MYHKRLKKDCRPNTGIFDAMEIDEARLEIIKAVQRETFSEVFTALMNHESFDVPRHLVQENDLQHSKELRVLKTLNPYVVNGILPVGSRLKNAALPKSAKVSNYLAQSSSCYRFNHNDAS